MSECQELWEGERECENEGVEAEVGDRKEGKERGKVGGIKEG